MKGLLESASVFLVKSKGWRRPNPFVVLPTTIAPSCNCFLKYN